MRLLTAQCCAQRMALPASEPRRMRRRAGASASGFYGAWRPGARSGDQQLRGAPAALARCAPEMLMLLFLSLARTSSLLVLTCGHNYAAEVR